MLDFGLALDSTDDLDLHNEVRRALNGFATAAASHPEVAGVILYGSALSKPDPADLDFVIVLDKAEYTHFYGVHTAGAMRCEVEYVTPPLFEEYFRRPHWRVSNWELDVGAKYVHGRILSDRHGELAAYRQRLTTADPELLKVRRYLFVHQLGQATSRLQKLAKRREVVTPELASLLSEFVQAFDAAAHHARLSYPRLGYTLDGWPLAPDERAALVAPGHLALKTRLLSQVAAEGTSRLGLAELLADCQDSQDVLTALPIYHLVDYTGLSRVLAQVRPDLQLPGDVMMPLFNV